MNDPQDTDPQDTELRRNEDGTLDELVAKNATVHLEQMGDDCWCLIVNSASGTHTMLSIYSERASWWRWLFRGRASTRVVANVIEDNYKG